MNIEYGEMISFVMSAASTILAVIPLLMIPVANEDVALSHIQLSQAEDIIHNNTSSLTKNIWAHNFMRDIGPIMNETNLQMLDRHNTAINSLNNDLKRNLSYFSS